MLLHLLLLLVCQLEKQVHVSIKSFFSNGLARNILKTMRKKKIHNKIVLYVMSKLNSTENIKSKALTDNEVSYKTLL